MATTLTDQANLAQDATFQGRVKVAACAAASAIHNEAFTSLTPRRDAFGKQVLLVNPANIYAMLATAIASDPTVSSQAGSPQNQANVTDAAINAAISSVWNSFAIAD